MRVSLGVAAMLLVAACGGASSESAKVDVELNEWAIGTSHDQFTPGSVVLDVSNSGEFPHTLVVEDSTGSVIAATEVIQSGESARLEIDLTATDYRFTCRIVTSLEDGTVVDHFEEGMLATVEPAG